MTFFNKPRGKSSILRQVLFLFNIQLLAVLVVMLSSIVFMQRLARERMEAMAENLVEIYGSQMNNRLTQSWNNLSRIIYDNYDPDLLSSDKEQERYYASVRLNTLLQNIVKTGDNAPLYVIADSTYGVCLDAGKGAMAFQTRNALRDFCMDRAGGAKANRNWEFLSVEGNTYLYRMLSQNTRVVAVFFPISSLLEEIRPESVTRMGFYLTDRSGTIQGSRGFTEDTQETLKEQLETKYSARILLANGSAALVCLQKKGFFLREVFAGGWFLLAAVALLLLFDNFMLHILRRRLVSPLKEATLIMGQIGEGNDSLRIPKEAESYELQTLSDSFNHLMDELLILRIEAYEKQLALAEAEQKYIRLQIRPHFFLNAMTTISSLSATGKTEEIQRYIDALSLNIRYMFSSGLYTVPLSEEIRHVKNYFDMQDLKYPDAVFSYIDMPPELESWPIPQMILHTLVENEYKYAITPTGSLTILIRISLSTAENGEEFLQIELEDDGAGYSEEILEAFAKAENTQREDGTRVGLYSIRRLLFLMYEREGLFAIGNVNPHGAYHRIRIPRTAVHERKRP